MGFGHELRDDDGDEEDAAADDVGNDDRGRVERAEPALEASRCRRGADPLRHVVSSCPLWAQSRGYRFFNVTAKRPKKTVSSRGSVVTALM